MHYSRDIRAIAENLAIDPAHVARSLQFVIRHTAHQPTRRPSGQTPGAHRRALVLDSDAIATVANIALRMADRNDEAHLLTAIRKTATGTSAHKPVIHRGVGTLPEFHGHPRVAEAIAILQAAGLPPARYDRTGWADPGFQVLPGDHTTPDWVFLLPDPDAEHRDGFTGGRRGYPTVMQWAGWTIHDQPFHGGLWAARHPDHQGAFTL
ncbi:hypothetical protein [Streptomyces fractus]|uniref:hypothetical protein n=1 Tax=Streptomyces fractus TaxID=641806 RepID=UPI003CF6DB5D